MDARKVADQAAAAVDDQIDVVKEAEQALVQARKKLEELEHASQQAHLGCPPTEGGTAVRWNTKGFGFITPRGGGPDLFVHSSCILDGSRLVEGAQVRYVRQFDEIKQRYRAEAVTGGAAEPDSVKAEESEADKDKGHEGVHKGTKRERGGGKVGGGGGSGKA